MSSATAGGSSTTAPPNFNLESDGHGTNLSDLENKTTPSYLDDASTTGSSVTPNPALEVFVVGGPTNGHVKEEVVSQPKRAAKIYNFCLGILFGEYLST
ncbi:UNVERIFIED_CONTAM: hypothetical protein Sradi_5557600 [Sesamum radiatum]|uniref:Uncharacterized protein n=1 Tax=Sesamum radiatum TaxID=300843 RepID=A0AAW2LEC7_SESRA